MTAFETVYATHNFNAENEDEISLRAGEVVIVLEKDEGYQDGWWRVKNRDRTALNTFHALTTQSVGA